MIEVVEIHTYELQAYLNKGYEFICTNVYSITREITIQEEIPAQRIVTTDTTSGYYNHQPTYIQKRYPVQTLDTKIILKRSLAAKLLYEKSLKNENNA